MLRREKSLGGRAHPLLYGRSTPTSPAGRASNAKQMLQSSSLSSVETQRSWVVAAVALMVMATAFGAPWITVVALKDIAAEVGGERSIPAFAGALVWVGSGIGGILMGRIAERVGVRWTVIGGALMIAVGLALSTLGPSVPLFVGHGLFVGLLGLGGINAPFYVYVSRWFDRRRGSALALISSGSFLAGALWPSIFERAIAYTGWRHTMLYYAALELLIIVPAAIAVLEPPPETPHRIAVAGATRGTDTVLGWPPNLVFALQACAIFTCCVPMSMPQAHLVAFCSDLGISAVHGAAMLSVLLGAAFLSRQVWGALSDRLGGLRTMLAGSACQTVGLAAFLLTQNEFGLFTVSAAFGFGFSGLVPANIMASRELFPVGEAYWRIPTLLLCSGTGMAAGAWSGGVLYDYFGYYAPAFATGVGVSMINFMIISTLAFRRSQTLATV
jgi:MFS family permease